MLVTVESVVLWTKMHAEFIKISNFLYWENGPDGQSLLVVSYNEDSLTASHTQLLNIAKMHIKDLPDELPDAAGVWKDEKIDSWESFGLKIVTPERLRPIILSTLIEESESN